MQAEDLSRCRILLDSALPWPCSVAIGGVHCCLDDSLSWFKVYDRERRCNVDFRESTGPCHVELNSLTHIVHTCSHMRQHLHRQAAAAQRDATFLSTCGP
jgi:hypothetical protein